MKLRYLINDDSTTYVESLIDEVRKRVTLSYYEKGMLLIINSVSIQEVLDTDPSILPEVHLAKKGRAWDLHIWKNSERGKRVSASVGILLPHSLTATTVELINDTTGDITLKDYINQPLDVYNSSMKIHEYTFENIAPSMTGTSGTSINAITVTDGSLDLLTGSRVGLPFLSGGAMKIDSLPFTMMFDISAIGDSYDTGEAGLFIEIGQNRIEIDKVNGIRFMNLSGNEAPTLLKDALSVSAPMVLGLYLGQTKAEISVDGEMIAIPGFNLSDTITEFYVGGNPNQNDRSAIDHILTHSGTPYRMDSEAPNAVIGIVAEPGFKEITLRWDKSIANDLAGYNVYINSKKHNTKPITENVYRAIGLENDTVYYATVTAVDTSGNESPSLQVLNVMPLDVYDSVPPAAPTGVEGVAGDETITVVYDENIEPDLIGYNVYLNGVKHNDNILVGRAYTLDDLENYSEYEIYVTAIDKRYNESEPSDVLYLMPVDTTPPAAITNLKENHSFAIGTGNSIVSLTWINPTDSDFSHCNIYRDGALVSTSNTGTFEETGLLPGSYLYTIFAEDKDGNESPSRSINVTFGI